MTRKWGYRDRAAFLLCIISFLAFNYFPGILTVIVATNASASVIPENIFVMQDARDFQCCPTVMQGIQTSLGNSSNEEIGKRYWLSRANNTIADVVGGCEVGCYYASTPAEFHVAIGPNMKSWRLPNVLNYENDGCFRRGIQILSWWKVECIYQHPGSLPHFKGTSTLQDANPENYQAQEGNYPGTLSDPILALGRTKMRISAVLFFAIPFIVFGRRLNLYGERVGDFYHGFLWWIGYMSEVSGWTLMALLTISLVGQWAYPNL